MTLTLNLFYIAASFFTISAPTGAFALRFGWTVLSMDYIALTFDVFISLVALLLLAAYSFKAVSIREKQYECENTVRGSKEYSPKYVNKTKI